MIALTKQKRGNCRRLRMTSSAPAATGSGRTKSKRRSTTLIQNHGTDQRIFRPGTSRPGHQGRPQEPSDPVRHFPTSIFKEVAVEASLQRSGKRYAVYPANFCPISRGGAVSQIRLRTTILHNHAGHCKRSLRCWAAPLRDPARCGFKSSLG